MQVPMFKMTSQFGNLSDNKNVNKASAHQQTITDTECIILRIFFSSVGSIGLLENAAAALIILRNRNMLDRPSNWFLLSLAITDAMFCFRAIPLIHPVCTEASCTNFNVLAQFAMTTNAGNVFIFTFDRFLSVYHSLRYPTLMTCTRARCLITVAWAVAFLLTAVVDISGEAGIENITYLHSSYYTTLIIWTIALNIYMFKTARDKRRVTTQQQNSLRPPEDRLPKCEICLPTRPLIATLTFLGASIPTIVSLYLYPTIPTRQTSSFQRKIVWCFVFMVVNSAADPLVYLPTKPVFRRYFKNARNRIFRPRSVGIMKPEASNVSVVVQGPWQCSNNNEPIVHL